MAVEEEWTHFEYGAKDWVMPSSDGPIKMRTVLIHDPETHRVIKLKMAVEEAQEFGKLVHDGKTEDSIAIPKGISEGDLRRGSLPGLPGSNGPSRSQRRGR